MLKLSDDLTNLLLLYLDYSSLGNLISLNKEYNNLLKQPSFWNDKLCFDYREFAVPTKIKDNYPKCLELYQQLLKGDDIKLLAYVEQNEYFEVAGWMSKMRKSIFTSGCNLLAKYGQVDILQNHLRFASPDENGLTAAIINKHHETVKFIIEKWKLTPNISDIIATGDLKFLQLCLGKYKLKFAQNDINHSLICGHFEISKWFASKKMLPNQHGLNSASRYDRLEILRWLADNYNLIPTEADTALIHQQYPTVEWLKTLGIEPGSRSIPSLIERNDIIALKQFLTDGILPSNSAIRDVVKQKNLVVLEIFLQFGIRPNGGDIDIAIINHDLPILRLLEQHNIIPDTKSANKAAEEDHVDILDWLLVYDILPTTDVADNVARKGKIKSLMWLAKYRIFPTSEGMKFAALYGYLDVLFWGLQYNILPSEDIHQHPILYGAASTGIPSHIKGLTKEEQMIKMQASKELYLKILEFLFEHGVMPSQTDINEAVYHQSIELLTLFFKYELFPEKDKFDKTKLTKVEFVVFLQENDLY